MQVRFRLTEEFGETDNPSLQPSKILIIFTCGAEKFELEYDWNY